MTSGDALNQQRGQIRTGGACAECGQDQGHDPGCPDGAVLSVEDQAAVAAYWAMSDRCQTISA